MTLSPDHLSVLDHAAAAPMLDQVLAWSAINSGSDNLPGLATMATLLADAFARLPGTMRLVDAAPVDAIAPDGLRNAIERGRNLHLIVRPDAPRRILLTGHMDTVYGADHPFQATRWTEAGRLVGPGVADMKGGLAIMLAALSAFETSPLRDRLGYDVVLNADEEVGSAGSAPLIADVAQGKVAALTYEPALPDGTLAGARPGSGNFSMIVTGRSAHAGRNPEEGRNAIVAAADLSIRMAALARPGLSVNPARIDGGGPDNVVPDHAILRINLRPATPEAEASARIAIDALVADVSDRHDVRITLHGGFGRPPKPIDPAAARLFALVRDCGRILDLDIAWRATGGVCDGNNIAACGVPVVDTMGARGGAIHSADEFLRTDSLPERARLSALLLLRLAEGATL